jgi:endonuclease/exonuclease/phosphatase family metal-dependent hydrolase
MKHLLTICCLLYCCSNLVLGQALNVMSFNIRYDNPNDGLDQWSERKDDLNHLLQFYTPTVLGIQEAVLNQIQFLDNANEEYAYIGVGRDDGQEKGEFSPILYDSTILELLDEGTFWLSTTPDSVSVGWDAALPRICTYGLFRHRMSEKVFWVFNTHFDHVGASARLNSAALIVRKINQMNISNAPVILMGDLNSTPDDGPIKLLNNHFEDAKTASPKSYGPKGTFFGFDLEQIAENRIDYIFGKQLSFESYQVIDDRRPNNRHISDHLPVFVRLSIN